MLAHTAEGLESRKAKNALPDDSDHSFVIMAYGECPYLDECLDSLKKQTIRSKIIMSTSTPNQYLTNMAQKHEIELIVNPDRIDVIADGNFALRQAATNYVTLAHQDHVYLPGYTETLLAAAKKHSNSLIAFCNYEELVHKDDKKEPYIRSKSLNFLIKNLMLTRVFKQKTEATETEIEKMKLLCWGNPIAGPSVIFNRKNIGDDFAFSGSFNIADWDAWINLAQKNGSFVFVNQVLLQRRLHLASNTSVGIANRTRLRDDRLMFEKFWPPLLAKIISRIYSLSYINNKV